MSKTIENEKGEEEIVYTAAELEAAKKEVEEATGKTLAEKETELANLRKISAEQKTNFKRYNEMTEAEKAAYDANTTEMLKRMDQTREELEATKKSLAEKEVREKDYTKSSILNKLHGNDDKVKATLESNYAALAGMPENTPEEIGARARAAATLAGIVADPRNPIYTGFSGEAPAVKQDNGDFTETDKGKEAADIVRAAMGLKADK